MGLAVLITITLACIAWSLWIRRVTWTCRWEVAATLNIALQGATVFLMSPLASETLGHWLHSLTGLWNLEDYIGHDMYVVAASAIVYNALGRLQDDAAMQRTFKQYVERPATLCIPLLLATHEAEADLQVGVAEVESIRHQAHLLGIRIVRFLDSAVIGAAGGTEGVVDRLGVDVTVEEVVQQRL